MPEETKQENSAKAEPDQFRAELEVLIRSKTALIGIRAPDERPVLRLLQEMGKALSFKYASWSISAGFEGAITGSAQPDPMAPLESIAGARLRCICALCDYHPYIRGDSVQNAPMIRRLKELAWTLSAAKPEEARIVVLVSRELEIPVELKGHIALLEMPYPTVEELKTKVASAAKASSRPEDALPEAISAVAEAARGLTIQQTNDALSRCLVSTGRLEPGVVVQEKKQVILTEGLIAWEEPPAGGLANVAGLEVFKKWLGQRANAYSDRAKAFGIPIPKGVLSIGVQGCGKSLTAKALAAEWGVPLLRVDMGALYGKYLGDTESNVRRVIKIVETVGRCVLLLDELEKAFAGSASSGDTDGGASSRALATWLTWFQEKTSPAFVAATSNDITKLPPELIRKGRLDEVFFVDLPNSVERRAIWQIHIAKRGRKPEDFITPDLIARSEGMSGAEIEVCVIAGLHRAFSEGTELSLCHLLEEISETVPLAKTAADKINALRRWSVGKARPASLPDPVTELEAGRFSSLEMDKAGAPS